MLGPRFGLGIPWWLGVKRYAEWVKFGRLGLGGGNSTTSCGKITHVFLTGNSEVAINCHLSFWTVYLVPFLTGYRVKCNPVLRWRGFV